jgi:uncharacterized protein YkwD
MVDGWIISHDHRTNMLDDDNQIGVNFANSEQTWYETQLFTDI